MNIDLLDPQYKYGQWIFIYQDYQMHIIDSVIFSITLINTPFTSMSKF